MNTVQRLSAALLAVFLFLLAGAGGALAQTLVGPGGNYATLAGAISAIEDGSLTGDVTLQIIGNLTNEPAEIVFDVAGGATSVTIIAQDANPYTVQTILNIGVSIPVQFGNGTDDLNLTLNGLTVNSGTHTIAAKANLTVTGNLTVNGTLTNNGTLTVNGASAVSGSLTNNGDVNFNGSSTVSGTLTVADEATVNLGADATVSGTLTINGDGPDADTDAEATVDLGGNTLTVANGATLTNDGDIVNGTVATPSGTTATNSTIDGSGNFPNVTIGSNNTATFGGSPTINGSLTVNGTVNGAGPVTLVGDNTTHTISGTFNPTMLVDATGVTINGSTASGAASTIGTFTVNNNGSAVIQDIKQITSVNVNTGASLQATLAGSSGGTITTNFQVQQGATASLGNANVGGTLQVTGALTQPSSLTLIGDVSVTGATTIGSYATLDIGTHTLTLGDDISVASTASLAGSGTFKLTGSTSGHDFAGKSIANLLVAGAAAIGNDVTVTNSLTVDDGDNTAGEGLFTILPGYTVTVSGTVTLKDDFAANTGGTLNVVGTTIQAPFASGFTAVQLPAVTIDAPGGVTFASSTSTNGTFQIQEAFTHKQGEISLGDNHLELQDNYTYQGGTYMAGNGHVIWNSAGSFSTGGNTVSFPNLTVSQALTAGNDDSIEIQNTLVANAAVSVDGDNDDVGKVKILDGASVTYGVNNPLGTDADDVELGNDLHVTYTATAATNVELPASVATLTAKGTGVTLTVNKNVTVNQKVTADGAQITVDDANASSTVSLTVAANGTIEVTNNGSFNVPDNDKISVTDYHLVYSDDVGTTYTAGPEFKTSANILSLTVKDTNTGVAGTPTLDLPDANVTVGDLILDNGEVIIYTTNPPPPASPVSRTLTITGNATVIGAGNVKSASTTRGTLAFAGSSAQTFTVPSGGLMFASGSPGPVDLQINNAAGVTLAGGSLEMGAGGTLILTKGLFKTGVSNWIVPDFDSSTDTPNWDISSGKGAIQGNVRLPLEDANDGDSNVEVYTVAFSALGTYDAAADKAYYRPVQIAFQNDEALQASGVQYVDVGYFDGDPGGSNGFPLMDGSLEITRYPNFFWRVRTSGSLPSSLVYNLRFEAEGYADFVAEDVNNTRLIRRHDGSLSNPWSLITGTGGYDNFNASPSNDHPVVRVNGVSGVMESSTQIFTFGLENNMVAVAPDAMLLNEGMTGKLTLSPDVFTGGAPLLNAPPSYTYAVSSSDDNVATATTDGDTLIVTAVGAGSATITIEATDRLGTSTSTTLTVNVNPDLVAQGTIANRGVNVDTTIWIAPLGSYFAGGTPPYSFAAASSADSVATASVSNDTLYVTGVAQGMATITVTATDSLGDTAQQSFTVAVNTGLAAADTIQAFPLVVGQDTSFTLSNYFVGGTPPVSFAAASSDTAVAKASVSGDVLTVSAVGAGMATITVTATDSVGATADFSFEVSVLLASGDVNGDGTFDQTDVVLVLQAIVGKTTLSPAQQLAADINGDGEVDVADAVLMLQQLVGSGAGKRSAQAVRLDAVSAQVAWGEARFSGGTVELPIVLKEAQHVYGVELELPLPETVTFEAIATSLPEGWLSVSHFDAESRVLRVALAGLTPASGEILRLRLNAGETKTLAGLKATVRLNAKETAELAPVTVQELPTHYALEASYPNPFRTTTTIKYQLPEEAHVTLVVYDIQGRVVARLVDAVQKAGYHTVTWDGRTESGAPAAAGLYLYRLQAGSFSAVQKVMLVR